MTNGSKSSIIRWRPLLIIIFSALGVGVILGIVAIVAGVSAISQRPVDETALPSPVSAVTRYLSAIKSGDVATASALDATGHNDFSDYASFGHGDVLADKADRISDFTVSAPASNSTSMSRQVPVTFTLDGDTYNDKVLVQWIASSKKWQIASSLVDLVSVSSSVEGANDAHDVAFTANGQRTLQDPDIDSTSAATYAMYPGIYSFRPVVDSGEAPAAQTVTILSRNVDTGGADVEFTEPAP